jgi:hypothetical protein
LVVRPSSDFKDSNALISVVDVPFKLLVPLLLLFCSFFNVLEIVPKKDVWAKNIITAITARQSMRHESLVIKIKLNISSFSDSLAPMTLKMENASMDFIDPSEVKSRFFPHPINITGSNEEVFLLVAYLK